MSKLTNFTRVWNPLLEALALANLSGSQYRICLALIRQSFGFQSKEAKMSLNDFQQQTGLHKKTISEQLKKLMEWQIVIQVTAPNFNHTKGEYKINKDVRKWSADIFSIDMMDPNSIAMIAEEVDSLPTDGQLTDHGTVNRSTDCLPADHLNSPPTDSLFDGCNPCGSKAEQPPKEIYKEISSLSSLTHARGEHNLDENIISEDDEFDMPFQRIEEAMTRKTGRFYYLKGEEPANIQKFLSAGGTLEMLLQAIDDSFATFKPKHPADRINTVNYCLSFAWSMLKRNTSIAEARKVVPMPTQRGEPSAKSLSGRAGPNVSKPITKGETGWLNKPADYDRIMQQVQGQGGLPDGVL